MSGALITPIISYVVIHSYYSIRHIDPVRNFPGVIGYVLDFTILALVYGVVFTALGALGTYRRDRTRSL